ncbi:hypothetical protein Bca101_075693 [Brassica carinata]
MSLRTREQSSIHRTVKTLLRLTYLHARIKVPDWFTRRRHKALVEDLKSRKLDLTGTSILNADSSLLGRTESLTVSPTKRRGPSPSSEPRLHEGSSWLRETSISTRVDRRGEEQREKKQRGRDSPPAPPQRQAGARVSD